MNPRNRNTNQRPSSARPSARRSSQAAAGASRPIRPHRKDSVSRYSRDSYTGARAGRHPQTSVGASAFAGAAEQIGSLNLDKGLFTIPNSELVITRRQFLYGAAGVGAVAAIGTAVAASGILEQDDADFPILTVPTTAVLSSEVLEEADVNDCLALVGRFELPYGTLVWCNDDDYAVCLVPGEAAKPLTQVQMLNLNNGVDWTVLEKAVGQNEGFEIYDVRGTASGLIWTEADILEGTWRIYTAKLDSDGDLGSPIKVDEGDHNWETPSLAMVDDYAYWQVMPRTDGNAATSQSALKKVRIGSSTVDVPYRSTGRMATPPSATRRGVCITPRTEGNTVHYQLTYLDASSNEVLDAIALPQSMKPLDVGYGKTGFMFCFEGIYDYGDGIANLGSYIPRNAATGSNYSNASWLRWSRTPTCAPCWCDNYLMVKSTQSVCGIDLDEMTYCATEVQTGSDDYGDYLATTGESSQVVTFANVISRGINQDEERYCLVRVYTAR